MGSPSQVGGRHQPFWNRWAEVTQDSWVLAIIREGYKLELVRQPLLSPIPLPFHLPADPEQVELVAQEIRSMLDKLAVEVVADHSPGFYSSIFLVRKKNWKWRPVINLRRLNQFLLMPHFRMESTRSLMRDVQAGDWSASIDLSDAYFHIPIHVDSRKFLRFAFRGQVYQFRPCLSG